MRSPVLARDIPRAPLRMIKPVFLTITRGGPKKLRKDFIISKTRCLLIEFIVPIVNKAGNSGARQQSRRRVLKSGVLGLIGLRQGLVRDKLGLFDGTRNRVIFIILCGKKVCIVFCRFKVWVRLGSFSQIAHFDIFSYSFV